MVYGWFFFSFHIKQNGIESGFEGALVEIKLLYCSCGLMESINLGHNKYIV